VKYDDLILLGLGLLAVGMLVRRRASGPLGANVPMGPAISRPSPPLSMREPPPMSTLLPGIGPSPYEPQDAGELLGTTSLSTAAAPPAISRFVPSIARLDTTGRGRDIPRVRLDTTGAQQGQTIRQGVVRTLPLFQPGQQCLLQMDDEGEAAWFCREPAFP